jgi:hypothetical protein
VATKKAVRIVYSFDRYDGTKIVEFLEDTLKPLIEVAVNFILDDSKRVVLPIVQLYTKFGKN